VSSLMFEVRGGRGTTARNKPNSSITGCGLAADLRGATNRAKQSQFLATPGGRRNSLFVVGDGVFAQKIQNTVLAYVVFWCSGVLGWRPEKRGSGAPARCVLGTWHVAIWIFGAKTRVVRETAGKSAGEAVSRGSNVQNKANCPKRGTETMSAPGRREGSGIRPGA
jgi:hypothetical protein